MCFVGTFVEGFALVLVMLDLPDVVLGYTAGIADCGVVDTAVDSVVVEMQAVDAVVVEIEAVDTVVVEIVVEGTDSVIVVSEIPHTANCSAFYLCGICIH